MKGKSENYSQNWDRGSDALYKTAYCKTEKSRQESMASGLKKQKHHKDFFPNR